MYTLCSGTKQHMHLYQKIQDIVNEERLPA